VAAKKESKTDQSVSRMKTAVQEKDKENLGGAEMKKELKWQKSKGYFINSRAQRQARSSLRHVSRRVCRNVQCTA